MTTFMSYMSEFAKQDIWSGEDLYSTVFTFISTDPLNEQFEFYGSDSMLFLTNSGSYFIVQL
jgi:hypothetical protein